MVNVKYVSKKVDSALGPKGQMPIKAQRCPRKKSTLSSLHVFANKHHNGNQTEAQSVVEAYFNGNVKFKEALLVVYICNNGMSMRLAKEVFHIGSHRYDRIKECREKLKPGGDKPTFVSTVEMYAN